MTVLEWGEAFKVGVAFMDEDHREAVALINAMAETADHELAGLFRRYLAHCEAHFAREERLMRESGFFAYGPHSGEHARVLDGLRATLAQLEAGKAADGAALADDLARWLVAHRNSMDLVTAKFASR